MKAWILLVASLLPPNVPAGAASPAAAPAPFVLRDVAAEAGVRFRNRCGSHTHKLFIVEQLGGGAALFDYDFDGDLDLYLVNGGDLAIARGQAPAVANALYRNEGDWRFVDVTARAGVGDTASFAAPIVKGSTSDGCIRSPSGTRSVTSSKSNAGTTIEMRGISSVKEPRAKGFPWIG
jgi:hypothetical protein